MTDATLEKLRALLLAYAERRAKAPPKPRSHEAERQRRAYGDVLRTVVRPVLEACMTELKAAGHEASTRDHTEPEDAYPSVALSFTPRAPASAGASPEIALASALIFKYDPRHGIVVFQDVKHSPTKGRVAPTAGGDRLGTMGTESVSSAWVATKTLSFIEAVLKAN